MKKFIFIIILTSSCVKHDISKINANIDTMNIQKMINYKDENIKKREKKFRVKITSDLDKKKQEKAVRCMKS